MENKKENVNTVSVGGGDLAGDEGKYRDLAGGVKSRGSSLEVRKIRGTQSHKRIRTKLYVSRNWRDQINELRKRGSRCVQGKSRDQHRYF